MKIREELELREIELLSSYSAHSLHSRGRQHQEMECDIRTCYQRDRDRILYSKAFRRLKDKTQVFLAPKGAHYRNRLTHTLEVSQIARTIARALQLNEDLTEAIALGHDLGHTPFGHAGEMALDTVSPYGFAHYKQSVRVVECIEKNGAGLNLTWETKDGILNHRLIGSPQTLEGQVVRYADKLAYIHHDMDDAKRACIISEESLPIYIRKLLGSTTTERLNTLVHNIIENSRESNHIKFSDEYKELFLELRNFMYEKVYNNSIVKAEESKAVNMLKELYWYYCENLHLLPEEYRNMIERHNVDKSVIVCDYLSGMTDQYSMEKFQEIFIPKSWHIS